MKGFNSTIVIVCIASVVIVGMISFTIFTMEALRTGDREGLESLGLLGDFISGTFGTLVGFLGVVATFYVAIRVEKLQRSFHSKANQLSALQAFELEQANRLTKLEASMSSNECQIYAYWFGENSFKLASTIVYGKALEDLSACNKEIWKTIGTSDNNRRNKLIQSHKTMVMVTIANIRSGINQT